MPALNVPPAPVSTPTARSSRASSWSNAWARALAVAPSTALRTLGRLMVITKTPSASRVCTVGASEVDITAGGLVIFSPEIVVPEIVERPGQLLAREPGRLLPWLGQYSPTFDSETGGTGLDDDQYVFSRQSADPAAGPS